MTKIRVALLFFALPQAGEGHCQLVYGNPLLFSVELRICGHPGMVTNVPGLPPVGRHVKQAGDAAPPELVQRRLRYGVEPTEHAGAPRYTPMRPVRGQAAACPDSFA